MYRNTDNYKLNIKKNGFQPRNFKITVKTENVKKPINKEK